MTKPHCKVRDLSEGTDCDQSTQVVKVNRLRMEMVEGETDRQALDSERMRLARNLCDRDSIRLDIQELEARRFDDGALTTLFDMYDNLKDRILRIEVRGPRLLKLFLRHACFDSTRAKKPSNPHDESVDEGHGTLRGELFHAEVFHNGALSSGTIRVYGTEREEAPSEAPRGSRHSFELTCCA